MYDFRIYTINIVNIYFSIIFNVTCTNSTTNYWIKTKKCYKNQSNSHRLHSYGTDFFYLLIHILMFLRFSKFSPFFTLFSVLNFLPFFKILSPFFIHFSILQTILRFLNLSPFFKHFSIFQTFLHFSRQWALWRNWRCPKMVYTTLVYQLSPKPSSTILASVG